MKLWKILLATMIALVLVCAVAMAEDAKTCADEGYACHGEFVYEVYETCDTDGLKVWNTCTRTKCANYGVKNTAVTQVVPAYGHDMKYTVNTNSTCTEQGVKKGYCQRTGCDYKVDTKKELLPHDLKLKGHKDAAHKQEGYDYYECANCDYNTKLNKVPAIECVFEFAFTVDPTCTTKGYDVWKCECGERKNENEVAALGHNYTIFVKTNTEPSCYAEGANTYQCDREGCTATTQVKLPKIAHEYAETWTVTVPATCTVNGEESRWCLMCAQARETRVLEAKGHNMTAEVVTVQPTCTTAGERVMKCRNCAYKVAEVVDALGHKWTNDNNPQIIVDEECTKDGLWTWKCQNTGCKETKTKVIAQLGHDYKETFKVEPTCDRAGLKTITCNRCDFVDDNIVVMPVGHKGEVTEYTAPTCTAEGSKTTKCEVCGKTVTETIAKLDHKYEWVTITPASPAGNGRDEYKCACGDVKEVKTVKYTKWYYNNTMTSFGPTTKELVGGSDWYRVTPVDLAVDGVYTYDLIASNKYVVGTVTITVNAGALTVSYKTNYSVDVKDEALLIYASKADLATGTAVTAPVGAAINAAETFGADSKVLVSLILTGDYDAAGKGLVDASAAAGMIANID